MNQPSRQTLALCHLKTIALASSWLPIWQTSVAKKALSTLNSPRLSRSKSMKHLPLPLNTRLMVQAWLETRILLLRMTKVTRSLRPTRSLQPQVKTRTKTQPPAVLQRRTATLLLNWRRERQITLDRSPRYPRKLSRLSNLMLWRAMGHRMKSILARPTVKMPKLRDNSEELYVRKKQPFLTPKTLNMPRKSHLHREKAQVR